MTTSPEKPPSKSTKQPISGLRQVRVMRCTIPGIRKAACGRHAQYLAHRIAQRTKDVVGAEHHRIVLVGLLTLLRSLKRRVMVCGVRRHAPRLAAPDPKALRGITRNARSDGCAVDIAGVTAAETCKME
jgi:hypothetical protein